MSPGTLPAFRSLGLSPPAVALIGLLVGVLELGLSTRLGFDRPVGSFAAAAWLVVGAAIAWPRRREESASAWRRLGLIAVGATLSCVLIGWAWRWPEARRSADFPTLWSNVAFAAVLAHAATRLLRGWIGKAWMVAGLLLVMALGHSVHLLWVGAFDRETTCHLLLGVICNSTDTQAARFGQHWNGCALLRGVGVALALASFAFPIPRWRVDRVGPRLLTGCAVVGVVAVLSAAFWGSREVGGGERLETSRCSIRYDAATVSAFEARRTLDDCEWHLRDIRARFPASRTVAAPVPIRLAGDVREHRRRSGVAWPHASPARGVHTFLDAGRQPSALDHELVHVLDPFPRGPHGWSEGLAVWLSDGVLGDGMPHAQAAAMLERGCLPDLGRLWRGRSWPSVRLSRGEYAASGSFIAFLAERHGADKLTAFAPPAVQWSGAAGRLEDRMVEWKAFLRVQADEHLVESESACTVLSSADRARVRRLERLRARGKHERVWKGAEECLQPSSATSSKLGWRCYNLGQEALAELESWERLYGWQRQLERERRFSGLALDIGLVVSALRLERPEEAAAYASRLPKEWLRAVAESAEWQDASRLFFERGEAERVVERARRLVAADPGLCGLVVRLTQGSTHPKMIREQLVEVALGPECSTAGSLTWTACFRQAGLEESEGNLSKALGTMERCAAQAADERRIFWSHRELERLRFRVQRAADDPLPSTERATS